MLFWVYDVLGASFNYSLTFSSVVDVIYSMSIDLMVGGSWWLSCYGFSLLAELLLLVVEENNQSS